MSISEFKLRVAEIVDLFRRGEYAQLPGKVFDLLADLKRELDVNPVFAAALSPIAWMRIYAALQMIYKFLVDRGFLAGAAATAVVEEDMTVTAFATAEEATDHLDSVAKAA